MLLNDACQPSASFCICQVLKMFSFSVFVFAFYFYTHLTLAFVFLEIFHTKFNFPIFLLFTFCFLFILLRPSEISTVTTTFGITVSLSCWYVLLLGGPLIWHVAHSASLQINKQVFSVWYVFWKYGTRTLTTFG